MKLGLQVVRFDWPGSPENTGSKLAEIARAAEEAGFYSLWMMDHYYQIAPRLGSADSPMLEGYGALQIAKQIWADDRSPYVGKHYRLGKPINSPQPLSKPHPPILIGGMGERRTLRLVAQYADACNLFARVGNEELGRKLEILRRQCDRPHRDYARIEKTSLSTIHLESGEMSPSEVIEHCRGLAEISVQHAIMNLPKVHDIEPIELIGRQVIPEVAGL